MEEGASVGPIPTPQVAPSVSATPQPLAPVADEASDDDLDEEWVRKAKAIVEKTRDDPFLASQELSKMKADYLRTRYNKQIKIAEDHAG